jgi:hypothetical protein
MACERHFKSFGEGSVVNLKLKLNWGMLKEKECEEMRFLNKELDAVLYV